MERRVPGDDEKCRAVSKYRVLGGAERGSMGKRECAKR
jgi:hypothetical protein